MRVEIQLWSCDTTRLLIMLDYHRFGANFQLFAQFSRVAAVYRADCPDAADLLRSLLEYLH